MKNESIPMPKNTTKILVVGCGVIGLTTAIYLQAQQYQVSIITRDLPAQSTSFKAAAIWLPFKANPQKLVNQWSNRSYDYFEDLAKIKGTGVSMIDFTVLAVDEQTPNWLDAVPENAVRKTTSAELPPNYQFGYVVHVPLIESPVYLDYLYKRFTQQGGQVVQQNIESLDTLLHPNQIIINCTGLGAKTLLNDDLLYPIQGHLALVEKKAGIKCISDDDGPNALAYVIPREDGIVIGGTAVEHAYDLTVDPKVIQQIQENCQQIEPNIKGLPIIKSMVGLRPARTSIRLEREPQKNLIHNYGHGGSGYTVSWGCAHAVGELLQDWET